MVPIKLVALIVSYNRKNKLKKAIETWLRTNVYKIVVVDNNSTDGTIDYLKSISANNKKVITIFNKKNLGGSGGFYKGLFFIQNSLSYDWVVLHDDDAYPDIASIQYFILNKNPFPEKAYMSAVYTPSGQVSPMNIPSFNPFSSFKLFIKTMLRGSKGFHLDTRFYDSFGEVEIDFASFVGLFLSKKIISSVGFPKKVFFIYADDLEYSLRIRKKGFKIIFDPNLIFYHDIETFKDRKKIYKPMWKAYFTIRNNIYLYRKISGKLFPFILVVKYIEWLMKLPYYDNKTKYIQLLYEALYDAFKRKFRRNPHEIIKKYQ